MSQQHPLPKRRLRLIHTKISKANDFSETVTIVMLVGFIVMSVLGIFFFRALLYVLVVPTLILTGFIMLFLLYGVVLERQSLAHNKKDKLSSFPTIIQSIVLAPFRLVLIFLCALILVLGTSLSVPVFIGEWLVHRYNDAVRRVYRKRAEMTPIMVQTIKQWEKLPFGRRFVFEGVIDERSKQFDNSPLVYQAQHEVYTAPEDDGADMRWVVWQSFYTRKALSQPIVVLFDGHPITVNHVYGRHPNIEINTQDITKVDNSKGDLYKGMRRIVGIGVGAQVRVHGKIQINERHTRDTLPYVIEKIELLSPLVQITRPPTVQEAVRDVKFTKSRFGGGTLKEAVDVDTRTDFSVFNYEPAISRFGSGRTGQSRRSRFSKPQFQTNKQPAKNIIEALSGQKTPPRKHRFGDKTSRFGSGQSRFGGSSSKSRFGISSDEPKKDIPYDDLTTATPENPLPFDDDEI